MKDLTTKRNRLNKHYNFLQAFMIMILVIIIIFVLAELIMFALDKQESYECEKWQKQAEQYPDYYWTDWQLEQCQMYRNYEQMER